MERWAVFRNGQFVHNRALDEIPLLVKRVHVLETLDTVTAVFEFVAPPDCRARSRRSAYLPCANSLLWVFKLTRRTGHLIYGLALSQFRKEEVSCALG